MQVATQSPLNQGQQAAADGFFSFLFNKEKEMKISGPAGVGKTFLMGHLIDRVLPQYFETCKLMGLKPEYDEVVMTATTNKAAEVLGLATNRPTSTIHSFLNLKVKNDFTTGRSRLEKKRTWQVHSRKIIFIDEAFTTDTVLYQLVHEGTFGCKIVWVGDHCQLGPVGENISPIHKIPMLFFELTEPMRNAGQPSLVQVCKQLRNSVETGIFQPIQCVPGVIDWVDDSEMERLITETFQHQTRDSRILAYTNQRVIDYNNHIRGVRQLPMEYGVGELLVNNQAITVRGMMLSVEEEIEILSQSSKTDKVWIDEHAGQNIMLEVRKTTFKSRLGRVFEDVPLPVDRDHLFELLRYYKQIKDWRMFYSLQETYPDLRPRDAATGHKAQGSTYDTVFIDATNLSTCHQPDVFSRLLYVAFSRAKNRVIFYGDLPKKYGGLVR